MLGAKIFGLALPDLDVANALLVTHPPNGIIQVDSLREPVARYRYAGAFEAILPWSEGVHDDRATRRKQATQFARLHQAPCPRRREERGRPVVPRN
ncbi:MAG: hypothetical protein HY267_08400 [Deltaproteobacteria bacterium]|nr:hypothetical protein [Deltaproteobacteria bacterium]